MWGKEVSATLIRKETKKRRKKHNFTCARECRQWRRRVWGLRERGNGGVVVCVPPDGRSRPSCVGCGGGPRAVVAGVVAAAPRRRALAVKKPYLGKRWQRSCEAGGTLSHATDYASVRHIFCQSLGRMCPHIFN